MIKLPIKNLNDFFAASSYIDVDKSNLSPILNYIKIEIVFGTCFITKTNNRSFVKIQFETSEEDTQFLIDESNLKEFCQLSNREFVTVDLKEGILVLKDGVKTQNINVINHPIEEFPAIPETNLATTRINSEVLACLRVAKEHASNDTLLPHFQAIYLKDSRIFSTTGNIMYIKEFNFEFPEIAITQKECDILSKFDYVDYCISSHYNLYKNGNIVYGFIQPDGARPFDYKQFMSRCVKDNTIKVSVSALVNFCQSTILFIKKEKFLVCNLDSTSGSVIMKFLDVAKGQKNEMEVPCTNMGAGFDFNFNPHNWSDVLAALPYEDICISDGGSCVFLWNDIDSTYFGLIQKTI